MKKPKMKIRAKPVSNPKRVKKISPVVKCTDPGPFMEYPRSICGVWWPLIKRMYRGPFEKDGYRGWRESMLFRGLSIDVEYDERDNPQMFTAKSVINPAGVTRVLSRTSAQFAEAGILKVRVSAAQRVDERLTAEELKSVGAILNHIYGYDDEKIGHIKPGKDVRPRWGGEERRIYDIKIHEMLMDGMSNRQVAKLIPDWAANNPRLAAVKTPSASALQKWASAERATIGIRRKGAR